MIEIPKGDELENLMVIASFKMDTELSFELEDQGTGFNFGEVTIEEGVYTWPAFRNAFLSGFNQLVPGSIELPEIEPSENRLRLIPEQGSGLPNIIVRVDNFENEAWGNIGGSQNLVLFNENPGNLPIFFNAGILNIEGSNLRYLQDWRIFQEAEFFEGFKEGSGAHLYNSRGRMRIRYMYTDEDRRKDVEKLLFNGQGYGGHVKINDDLYPVSFSRVGDTFDIVDDISIGGKQAINLEIFPRRT